jgi:hypothetical protein
VIEIFVLPLPRTLEFFWSHDGIVILLKIFFFSGTEAPILAHRFSVLDDGLAEAVQPYLSNLP